MVYIEEKSGATLGNSAKTPTGEQQRILASHERGPSAAQNIVSPALVPGG